MEAAAAAAAAAVEQKSPCTIILPVTTRDKRATEECSKTEYQRQNRP